MEYEKDRIAELESKVAQLSIENEALRSACTRDGVQIDGKEESEDNPSIGKHDGSPRPLLAPQFLSGLHIERYSRQLLLSDGFGVAGQKMLLASSVLVVGAGGIGSTAIPYLAAAGVGRLGICDGDTVDVSNLHRQIMHRTPDAAINLPKVNSAQRLIEGLNPTVDVQVHPETLTTANVMEMMRPYDCVVDCSDNPQTRYLINDACVLLRKPLVSASAVGIEGQMTVYNYCKKIVEPGDASSSAEYTSCYRCLYPSHQTAVSANCQACSDAGVWGPVPGLMGVLQATEVLKIITGHGRVMWDRLLLYNALDCSFTTIKKPGKRPTCPVCSDGPHTTIRSMDDCERNLHGAPGPSGSAPSCPISKLSKDLETSCIEYEKIRQNQTPHLLLDVRVAQQYELCHLEGSVHIPLETLPSRLNDLTQLSLKVSSSDDNDNNNDRSNVGDGSALPIYCICRRGIASAEATRLLNEERASHPGLGPVYNITGGLTAWRTEVDQSFPRY